MDSRTVRSLKQQAQGRLEACENDPRTLALIHGGAALLAGLLTAVVSLVLNRVINNTGGLSDLGLRTVLGSARTSFTVIVRILLPFWSMGFTYCTLRIARGQDAPPKSLLEGFRRWGVILRLYLAQIAVCLLLLYLAIQVSGILVTISPFADPLITRLTEITGGELDLQTVTPEQTQALLEAMTPVYILVGVLFVAGGIPVFYRLRLAPYEILGEDRPGAVRAMRNSVKRMRGSCMTLFRMDLGNWWYFALSAVCSVLAYLDLLLPLAGVSLPVPEDVASVACYVLYAVAMLPVYYFFSLRVETGYAVFHTYLPAAPEPPRREQNGYPRQ